MVGEVTTIVGEVEEKKKSYQEKAHTDKWTLKVNGEWVSLLKPGQPAFESGASKAEAWNIAEKVMEGEWVEAGHEGQYKNIVSLAIVARPEGAPKATGGEKTDWEAKNRREDMRSALHAAVQHAEGKDTKSEDVIKVAEAFYKAIRGAE